MAERARAEDREPVVNLFPDFDDNLRARVQREIELFFDSIVQEDRSVLDLLDADYTFVNERLAKHYGIPNIYGAQFRRVTLPAELDMRRGLLGKGALLTVTSNPARTSPVTRGKWFMATFLGVEPPQPPPGVEVNISRSGPTTTPATRSADDAAAARAASRNPTCASCHKIFEPMGLALENFDAVGAWRTLEEGIPVDASGVLVDGTKVRRRGRPARGADALFGSVRARRRREAAHLRARPRRRVRGHAARAIDRPGRGARASTGSRRSCWASSRASRFQMNMKTGGARTAGTLRNVGDSTRAIMFITKKHIPRRTVLRGAGAAGAAVPRGDGAREHGAGADRGQPEAAIRRPVRAARRGAGLLGAGKVGALGPSFRSSGSRSSRSATHGDPERPALAVGRAAAGRDRRRSLGRGGVHVREQAEEDRRRRRPGGHDDRSDHRAEDRAARA